MKKEPSNPQEKQRNIESFIRDFFRKHGYAPSQREIRDGVSISSVSVVRYHLLCLEKLGVIQYRAGQSRGLQLVNQDHGRYADIVNAVTIASTEFDLPEHPALLGIWRALHELHLPCPTDQSPP